MYDKHSKLSDMKVNDTTPVTVRVRRSALREIMRKRRWNTQSDAINTLIAEEQERQRAWAALKATAGSAGRNDFNDRLL